MPTDEFRRDLTVDLPRRELWEVLMDVERVAGWVGLVGEVRELSPMSRYRAELTDRVGPFRLRADLDVRITEIREGSKVALEAEGEDRQVRSRIKLALTLWVLDGDQASTDLRLEGRYEVTGRVATLGASMIRHKAEKILDHFCASAAEAA
ncbi:MAG: SRPBCC domain-containing protein [bacterium]|nr:SRPBCC domain-containing protein [bacterium]MDE0600907.1 SRPBCC domain-containing protein [bacterium]